MTYVVSQDYSDKDYAKVDVAVHINSSLETSALYKEFKEKGYEFKQDQSGYLYTLAFINDQPICVAPLIHVINGKRVMYVEATSVLVEWNVIDEWIRRVCGEQIKIVSDPINLLHEVW